MADPRNNQLPLFRRWRDSARRNSVNIALGLFVFLVAFSIRVVYLNQLRSSPLFDEPVMDELYHHQWAQAIAEGKRFIEGPYFRAPLYPALLAAVYKVFGHGFLAPRIVQALLGSLSCVLVFVIARSLFGRLVGILAALVSATYWILVYHDAELLIAPLIVFLDLSLILILVAAWQMPLKRYFALAGLVLGLSAIARPNILLFAPAIAIWMVFLLRESWRKLAANIALFAGGIAVVIAPVTLRNYLVGHDLVLIASQGGVNFYIGNNPLSDGRTAIVPGTPGGWWEGYKASIERAEKAMGRKLKASEVSTYYYQEGWKFIREQPRQWLRLTWLKVRLWWSRWEWPNDKGIYFITEEFTPIIGWLPMAFGVVAPLGLLGIALSRRHALKTFPLWGFVLVYTLSFIPFFCTSRYRVPIVPPLIILGVWALAELARMMRSWKWKSLSVSALVLAIAIALVYYTPSTAPARNDAFDLVRLGNAYLKKGRLAAAEESFRRAVVHTPYYFTAQLNLGSLLLRMNRLDEAIHQLRFGLSSNVRLSGEVGDLQARAHFLLAQALDRAGEVAAATRHYEMAGRLNPAGRDTIDATRRQIAAVKSCIDSGFQRLAAQQFAEAARELTNCLNIDPDHAQIQDLMLNSLIQSGDFERAVAFLKHRLGSNQEWAAANLAVILALAPVENVRNPSEALEYARQACPDLQRCGPFFLDALAVAVAENGDRAEGIRLTKLALQRAQNSPVPIERGLAPMIQSRLEAYESGRPFRLPMPAKTNPRRMEP